MSSPKHARVRLEEHLSNLENHFKKASDFLVKCQIAEPYVCEGTLKGSVCPWEIGVADTHGLTILEDFHDTLEAYGYGLTTPRFQTETLTNKTLTWDGNM